MMNRSRSWGTLARDYAPGPRALKSALAVAIAWWLATLLGQEKPIFAALGALVAVETTVLASLRRTGLQLVGILGGVLLATLFSQIASLSPFIMAAAVLFGLWLGRLVGSPDRIGIELSVTALLVVVWGQGDLGFGEARLWETALGGLVAVIVNALLFPPSYLKQVLAGLDRLADSLAADMVGIITIFVTLPGHEGIDETQARLIATRSSIARVDDSLQMAEEALRFSPLVRGEGDTLKRCRDALQLYRATAIHSTSLARIIRHHSERPHTWSHSELKSPPQLLEAVERLADAIEAVKRHTHDGEKETLVEAELHLEQARTALGYFFILAHEDRSESAVERFVDVAAMASDVEHLAKDVADTLRI